MIQEIGKYYLYRHIRLDTKVPFYIGIGTKIKGGTFKRIYKRAFETNRRSEWWKKVAVKTGYEIEILLESDDYEFIKQKEIEFIALYKRIDCCKGILVNLTDGGEGIKNRIIPQEIKDKISNTHKGKKLSQTTKNRLSIAHKQLRENGGGNPPPPPMKGESNPMFGKTHSKETVEKIKKNQTIKRGQDHPSSKIYLDLETGIYYFCFREVAEVLNTSISYIAEIMCGRAKNKSIRIIKV